jgi:hypothetical protein
VYNLFGQSVSLVIKGIPADAKDQCGTGKINTMAAATQIERRTMRPLPWSSGDVMFGAPDAVFGSAAVIWETGWLGCLSRLRHSRGTVEAGVAQFPGEKLGNVVVTTRPRNEWPIRPWITRSRSGCGRVICTRVSAITAARSSMLPVLPPGITVRTARCRSSGVDVTARGAGSTFVAAT